MDAYESFVHKIAIIVVTALRQPLSTIDDWSRHYKAMSFMIQLLEPVVL